MAEHNDLGAWGEALAVDYLSQKGHQILETSWRYSKGEIDIISMEGDVMVFTEVKTRTSAHFGKPEEFVDDKKMLILSRTATAYMNQQNYEWEVRFDVVSIVKLPHRDPIISHFTDAFFLGI
ncbi:MAG: YraN family protein [Bacteroidota bacterium]